MLLFGLMNPEGLLKIVNYEADADTHKTEGFNSEVSSALAYNTSLPLTKTNISENTRFA